MKFNILSSSNFDVHASGSLNAIYFSRYLKFDFHDRRESMFDLYILKGIYLHLVQNKQI